jgi:hypothetical protein
LPGEKSWPLLPDGPLLGDLIELLDFPAVLLRPMPLVLPGAEVFQDLNFPVGLDHGRSTPLDLDADHLPLVPDVLPLLQQDDLEPPGLEEPVHVDRAGSGHEARPVTHLGQMLLDLPLLFVQDVLGVARLGQLGLTLIAS